MHPIYKGAPRSGSTTKQTFGVHGLAINFNAASTLGYIVKQSGTNSFIVSDGTSTGSKLNTWKVRLAKSLPLSDGYCTIPLAAAAPSGATFVVFYMIGAATVAASGTGYTVGDALSLATPSGATLAVATINGSGGVTGVTIVGSGNTQSLSSTPVAVTGGSGTGATFNLTYSVKTITCSGGTDYHVGDHLTPAGFNGTPPVANVSAVSNGAPTTVTVSNPGSGITTAGTVSVRAVPEHVAQIRSRRLVTIEGNSYKWNLGSALNGSVALSVFS